MAETKSAFPFNVGNQVYVRTVLPEVCVRGTLTSWDSKGVLIQGSADPVWVPWSAVVTFEPDGH